MIDRGAARRYAEAFVGLLEKAGRIQPALEELKFVSETYADSADLRRFLGSPEIAPEEKERLLSRLLTDRVSPEVERLVDLALRWDRIDHLPAIAQEAAAAAEARQGILRGTVTTAHPISSAEAQALAKAVGKRLGKQVVLERQVDPRLLGGARMAAGSLLLDGSVANHLERIREHLLEAKVT